MYNKKALIQISKSALNVAFNFSEQVVNCVLKQSQVTWFHESVVSWFPDDQVGFIGGDFLYESPRLFPIDLFINIAVQDFHGTINLERNFNLPVKGAVKS